MRKIELRKIRQEKNMTQQKLAEKIGVTQQSVAKWENGLAYPRFTVLVKLASVLGCTVADLVKEETSCVN